MGGSFTVFMVSLSHLSILALTFDRYVFIKRPLHYPLIITPARTWMMVLLVITGAVVNGVGAGLSFQVNISVLIADYFLND